MAKRKADVKVVFVQITLNFDVDVAVYASLMYFLTIEKNSFFIDFFSNLLISFNTTDYLILVYSI